MRSSVVCNRSKPASEFRMRWKSRDLRPRGGTWRPDRPDQRRLRRVAGGTTGTMSMPLPAGRSGLQGRGVARAKRSVIPFPITDGDRGCMRREEMLARVLLPGAVHRGKSGRLLGPMQIDTPQPRDTPAVHLHRAEPAGRNREMRLPVLVLRLKLGSRTAPSCAAADPRAPAATTRCAAWPTWALVPCAGSPDGGRQA